MLRWRALRLGLTAAETEDGFDHRVAAKKAFTVLSDCSGQARRLQLHVFKVNPHQNNARDCLFPAEDKIAEILVFGEQESPVM